MPTGRFMRSACVLAAALVMAGMAVTPASAGSGPNIKVTAIAQEGHWLSGDVVGLDVTVSNIGDAAAFGVFGTAYSESGTAFWGDRNQWGDLSDGGHGTTIAQGETRQVHLTGQLGTFGGDSVVHIEVYAGNDADYSDNIQRVTVPMAQGTDRVAGVLYGDGNGDGKPSPGEGLAGAEAHFIGVGTTLDMVAITDATGHFAFNGLPLSHHASLSFQKVPGGWVDQPVGDMRLDGRGAYSALEVRAVRPLSDVLHETLALDKTSYAPGATAKVTVTLSNSSDKPMTGLSLGCGMSGAGTDLAVTDDQWGAFSSQRHEGTLAPGQQIVLTAQGKVADNAAYMGAVGLACGAGDGHSGGAPYVTVIAKVPGMRADSTGHVWADKNGDGNPEADEGLANVTVALVEDGKFIRSYARTDANGDLTFKNVAVGKYQLRVLGPWKPAPFEGALDVFAPPYGGGQWYAKFVAS